MNLGLLMGVGAQTMPNNPTISTNNTSAGGTGFGSVFQSLMNTSGMQDIQPTTGSEGQLAKMMKEILQAGDLEELARILEQLGQGDKKSDDIAQLLASLKETGNSAESLKLSELVDLKKFPSLQQLASLISKNPAKLVDELTKVLDDAGAAEDVMQELLATGNVWLALEALQQIPPEQLKISLEQLPKQAAVELTAMFKAIELAAPRMDLLGKQADLSKNIQPILAQFATVVEDRTIQPEVKPAIVLPSTAQHMIRFVSEQSTSDTNQQSQQSKANEAQAIQATMTQTEAKPVFNMQQLDKAPESRSEALMREFQAILNRANFGQTNGMNRLSIKLYPEHLGTVRIELLEVNGIMTARILASTAMAREMLDSQMHQLRHAFSQQNLQVERIDLSQTIQEPSRSDREQAFNKQNEQQKEQPSDSEKQQDDTELTFEEFMIELEV